MSYAPGTILSYANGSEYATVLSDNNALVTKCLGTDCQVQMNLLDWLNIANGKEQAEFIPIPQDSNEDSDVESIISTLCSKEVCSSAFQVYAKGRMAGRSHDDMVTEHGDAFRSCTWCNPKEMPCYPGTFCGKAYSVYMAGKADGKNHYQISREENEAFQVCEACHPKAIIDTYPIGTILRWNHEYYGEENRRTAVITKLGILQIKTAYSGLVNGTTVVKYDKILFPSITKWRESLPGYGSFSISRGVSSVMHNNKTIESLNDYDTLSELCSRFNVHQTVHLYKSSVEIHSNILLKNLKSIEYYRDFLSKRSLEDDIEDPGLRKKMTDILVKQIESYNKYKEFIDTMTSNEKNRRHPFDIYPKGTTRLYAYVNRRKRLITTYEGKIAVAGLPMATTFQGVGIDFYNDKPKLVAIYRKKEIKLY